MVPTTTHHPLLTNLFIWPQRHEELVIRHLLKILPFGQRKLLPVLEVIDDGPLGQYSGWLYESRIGDWQSAASTPTVNKWR